MTRYNTLNKPIYDHSLDPQEKTINQFKQCASCDFVDAAALMPDAHVGYVAPVGAVLQSKEYLVPAWVGYDIGCGVTAAKINVNKVNIERNANAIYNSVQNNVPMGKGKHNRYQDVSDQAQEAYEHILDRFLRRPHHNNIKAFFEGSAIRHIGSLGSGNHFIEIDYDDEDNAWVVVHSGSRGVGYKVAKRYMERSAGTNKEYEATHPIHEDSDLGKEYRNILDFGLSFASENRLEMVRKVARSLESALDRNVDWDVWTNKNHNHAVREDGYYVHRKGATPAKEGERGVIPANMRDGSYLVVGKGDETFLESSSHGAGRTMSRTGAKDTIDIDDFKDEMQGVVGWVDKKTLDEAPQAYKDINDVLAAQQDSIDVKKHLRPLINWKGG
jgi:tRNA-splicing ligase RtcB